MSDFKGVKGPWVSEGYDVYAGDMDAHICIVSSFIDEETEDAHVNLIAAAPELLEALQLIIKDLRTRAKVRGDIDDDGTVVLDVGSSVLMKANDAIAKALGQ